MPQPPLFEHSRPPGELLETILEGRAHCGDLFRLPLGKGDFYILCHPELALEVLVNQKNHFVKLGGKGRKAGLQRLLGSGLLTNPEPESWFARRRILMPLFHKERINKLGGLIIEAGERLLRRWQGLPKGASVDISAAMLELGHEILYQLLFSLKPQEVGTLTVPLYLATARADKVQQLKMQLDEMTYRLINERKTARSKGQQFDDVLALLLEVQARDQTLSDQHIRDELLTLFAAGHETTAYALSWAFYALAGHQEIQRNLQTELDSVLGKRKISQEKLRQLPYNTAVFKETLRLYPTIPSAPRVARETAQLGFDIPKGSRILVSLYAIHRHPEFWTEYERFLPERFQTEPTHPHIYLPFGLGERFCLGRNLALLQGQLVLAQLSQALHFQPPEQPVKKGLAVSLFPQGGLKLHLSFRDAPRDSA